jgi:hypothetical protein
VLTSLGGPFLIGLLDFYLNPSRQIGLGSNVTLGAITVPTEVALWRMVSQKTRSKCLNVTASTELLVVLTEVRINYRLQKGT